MTLDFYRGDLVARASHLATLNTEELHRRAAVAARDKDPDTLWALTEAYLTTHGAAGARVSPHTLRTYGEAVRAFLTYATDNAVNLLSPGANVGALYLRHLEAAGKSAATVRVKLAGARTLYKALRWAGATTEDAFADARAAPDSTAAWDKRQPYTEEEMTRLLGAADARMTALLLLCGHSGLRIAEALALAWADVDLSARALTVKNGKGGKTRRVNLSRSLGAALEALETMEGWEDLVIGGGVDAARERLGWLCKRAGVGNKGFHALRHYAGTKLVREGHSLDAAARHLGHASIETTRIYAKWADDGLREALDEW
ncbi:tyrosine-type recombinase/integrase [Deinococcus radiopugnans]|uniref:Integrase/recombinase XerC n=1 Tax=Deinococcus radiopugnans ATCC 19172 TaxID=585398 RepID=A0A5C4XP76_9DEIO|nr:tyrosine-type recombinase/integrase [Deinococcus radiopugnans]MBB6018745.1 integrase/recombinase XerC [Deinococcus radiopugnans ATCC 19172]TNM64380.1 site-specific integrase [Deinococcus radiopugnans ATCC 19172]